MRFKLLAICAILAVFAGCENNQSSNEQNTSLEQPAPQKPKIDLYQSFDINFINSDQILTIQKTQKGLQINGNDKPVFFVFFKTWCPVCQALLPHLVHLQKKYQDDIRIIGVLLDGMDDDGAVAFVSDYNATHRFSINFEISNSPNNELFSKVVDGVSGIPFMALYDANGEHKASFLGGAYEEFIDIELGKLASRRE